MRPSTLFLSAIFLLAGFPAALCQTEIADPTAKQICASVKDVELPTADRPSAAEESTLAGCSSVDAYFGFEQSEDQIKARKCAYAEMDRNEKALLSGKAVLMMIYANARGVPRNFDVALKLACSIGGSPADAAGRVRQLDRLRKANWAGNTFSICDHSNGPDLYEQCAILQGRFDKIERDQKLNALSAGWTTRQQKAFHSFLQEADRFFKIHAGNGVNLEGTFEIQEEVFLWNNLVSALEQFERGELPKYSAGEFLNAEAAEKALYLKTQNGNTSHWGTVTSESIRKSEDEWRRYASAWLAFAKEKYPGVSEQSWKAWLDQERVTALGRLPALRSRL